MNGYTPLRSSKGSSSSSSREVDPFTLHAQQADRARRRRSAAAATSSPLDDRKEEGGEPQYSGDNDDDDDATHERAQERQSTFINSDDSTTTTTATGRKASSSMQLRQFTRTKDAIELDDMEEGISKVQQQQPLLNNGHTGGHVVEHYSNGTGGAPDRGGHSEKGSVGGTSLRKSVLLATKKVDDLDEGAASSSSSSSSLGGLTDKDKRAMVLLVALYLLQGIPVGLAFGSIPYLLRSKLSYSQIGIFTLCTYPYSLKLLWSPIVDSLFFKSVGRRKSWIVPIQCIVGCMLWWLSRNIDYYMDRDVPDVKTMTILFFTLVFFAATQDIAVDGWALTLLSKGNLSYASTAQTIGLNSGYFLSFTVFLAFNSVEFSNKYFRSAANQLDYPLVSLAGYLKFGAMAYFAITGYLAFFQPEDPILADDPDMDLKRVYTIMYRICRLKHVQSFALVHLVSKLGTAANDAATSLKLLEKGLSKEDLALAVLIDFPFQIIFGWLAARWSAGDKPLRPWIRAMWARLGFAITAMLLISYFPSSAKSSESSPSSSRNIPFYYFMLVILSTVLSSFASTVQFVGISAFHTQIADPAIGGTYMTLLNTVSNLGGTWPRYFVLRGVDTFTKASCLIHSEGGSDITVSAQECVSDHGKAVCADLGGVCRTDRDGYYITTMICIALGAALLIGFVQPTARKLQSLPGSAWRVKLDRQ